MVKNWAEVSSDEEDVHAGADEEPLTAVNPDVLQKEIAAENRAFADGHDDEDEDDGGHPQGTPKQRTYTFPTEPPYTAYVGNLSYNIVEPRELQEKLLDCVQRLLPGGTTVNIVDTRIMMDRKHQQQQQQEGGGFKPRHRGFAYVQVETLDMLKALVQLNDHAAAIDGRVIILDTSVMNDKRNRGGGGRGGGNRNRDNAQKLPDGSQFRGGRFTRSGGSGRGSGGSRRQSEDSNGDNYNGPPVQRTSLKLAPRSRPVEDGGNSNSTNNIFGGGKARDEQVWQARRRSQSDKPTGGGGRGNGGGRGHNKGSSQKTGGRKDRKAEGKAAPAKQPVVTPKAAAPAPAPPAEKKIVNKFAALDFSDSD